LPNDNQTAAGDNADYCLVLTRQVLGLAVLSRSQNSDLPTTVSIKYGYADDPAIMHANGDRQAVKGVLTKDMATVGEYLQTWKLKLSTTKTVSAAFQLNNKEAKRELIK